MPRIATGRVHDQQSNGETPDAIHSFLTDTALLLHAVPNHEYARDWLTTTVRLLLDRNKDSIVLEATGKACRTEAARLIRALAERESEIVVMRKQNSDATFALFAVPVIVEFRCEVPAGIVDCALSSLNWAKELLPGVKSVVKPKEYLRLITRFHSLDDLATSSLSAIRKAGRTLAANSSDDVLVRSPFDSVDVPMRRSNTFLRYIVGQRLVSETTSSSTGAEKTRTCPKLACAIEKALKRQICQECHVDAFYNGSFHDTLYTGMWMYQERRLASVSWDAINGTYRDASTSAIVLLERGNLDAAVDIGFFEGTIPIGGTGYRLRTRPGEEMDRCVTRIAKAIAAAGIAKVECVERRERMAGYSNCNGPRRDGQLIVVPL